MPEFRYKAVDAQGRRRAGAVVASSEALALAELEQRQLTPLSVEARATGVRVRTRGASPAALARAYASAADLLKAGVPILRALRLLAKGKSQPALAEAFAEVADRVADGEELSSAMERRPGVFRPVHVAMIRAGEKGGFLDEALARLGALLERQAELRAKVLGSLVYPAVLTTLGGGVLIVVFAVFVPQFRPLFARLEELPFATELVFAISDAVTRRGLLTLGVVAAVGAGLFAASRRPEIRREMAGWPLRVPVIGPVLKAIAVARLCRLLGTMLGAGVPLLASLRVTREAAGHPALAEAVDAAAEAVRAGEPLATPLAASGLLSEEVTEMIAVGEAANALDTVLVQVAESLERRVDRLLGAAVKLIEPLLLVVLAGAVGLVAVALLLPLTQLSGQV